MKKATLQTVTTPPNYPEVPQVFLTEATMIERKQKVLKRMQAAGIDTLILYADKEHGSNFEYLTGFFPRFEEALLVLTAEGKADYIMGNENLKMVSHARLAGTLHHCPLFSLPNQPMEAEEDLAQILATIGIGTSSRIGLVGWKMFTTKGRDPLQMFDLPYFIMEAIQKAAATSELVNACHLLIGEAGARVENNANEIAHYEYGANLAAQGMWAALNKVQPGVKEIELGAALNQEGQLNNVVTIAAAGERFAYANFYPTQKAVQLGDPISLTISYKGGLSSRTGFAIEDGKQLPEAQADYLEKVVYPYFNAVTTWLEKGKLGTTGGELYEQIENAYPKAAYGWHLNPGHLVADEEWVASPIYAGSTEQLTSGMLLQIDLIPSIKGYQGTSTEECVLLADEALKNELATEYPELWVRISERRRYLQEVLGIQIHEDILPMSNLVGYLPPFLLAVDQAVVWQG